MVMQVCQCKCVSEAGVVVIVVRSVQNQVCVMVVVVLVLGFNDVEYNLCFDCFGATEGVGWGLCGNGGSDQVWMAKVNQMLW